MIDTLMSWLGLAGALGFGGLLLFFVFGGGSIGAELAKLLRIWGEALAPLLLKVADFAGEALIQIGHFFLAGLKEIFKQTPTLVTVVVINLMLWSYMKVQYEDMRSNRQAAINECYAELRKLRRTPATPQLTPAPQFKWFWEH